MKEEYLSMNGSTNDKFEKEPNLLAFNKEL